MRREGLVQDDAAVDAIVATVLTIFVALVLVAGVFFILQGIMEKSAKAAPAVGLVTDGSGSSTKAWQLRVQAVNRESHIPDYLLVVRTPANGTLVARPVGDLGTGSYWWSLTAADGVGTHAAQSVPGTIGGFHLRYTDTNANARFDAGDRFALFYDGDGDGGHQDGPDDLFPPGAYTFELKHIGTDSLVASISRE